MSSSTQDMVHSALHDSIHRRKSSAGGKDVDDEKPVEESVDNSAGSESDCSKTYSRDTSNEELKRAITRSRLENIRQKAVSAYEEIQERYNDEMRQLLCSVTDMASPHTEETNGSLRDNVSFSYKQSPQKKVTKKMYVARNSVLTEILQLNHIRTLYNIFVAMLITFCLQTIVYDLLEEGRIRIDFTMISWGFGKFPIVMSIWMSMMGFTLSVFPVFNLWTCLHQASQSTVLIDGGFLLLYIVYFVGFLWLPVISVLDNALPPVSSLVVVCEQVRMLMKIHAFIRENVPKTLASADTKSHPGFSKYLYFLFAPTLVYRDEYPRSEKIVWNNVVTNISQLIACIFFIYYIFTRFCVPNFQNFNSDHVTLRSFTISVFGCMMPGTLVLLIGFYAILHLWLNAWAEMLRFADKLFYKDWWNSTSFASYYRNWNIVVHDWLYTYLYQDVYMLFGFRHKWLAMHLTFLISAVVHEYVLVVALKFFYPILFFQFGIFGVCIIYVINGRYERVSNIAMWTLLFFGTGLLMCMLSMEWYARINCAPLWNSSLDYLLPRSWFCESLSLPPAEELPA